MLWMSGYSEEVQDKLNEDYFEARVMQSYSQSKNLELRTGTRCVPAKKKTLRCFSHHFADL